MRIRMLVVMVLVLLGVTPASAQKRASSTYRGPGGRGPGQAMCDCWSRNCASEAASAPGVVHSPMTYRRQTPAMGG